MRRLQARRVIPATSDTANKIRKIKNRILAMPAAAAAIPKKPKTAAMSATMKNARAQRNIDPPVAIRLRHKLETQAGAAQLGTLLPSAPARVNTPVAVGVAAVFL